MIPIMAPLRVQPSPPSGPAAMCWVLHLLRGPGGPVFTVRVDSGYLSPTVSVTGARLIKVDAHGVKMMMEAQLPGGDG